MPEIHPLVLIIVIALLYLGADVLDRRRQEKIAGKKEEDDDQDFPF